MEDLTKASHKLAEEIYRQASAKQKGEEAGGQKKSAEGQAAPGGKKDEDIIDAEYKEEDKGKV